MNKNKVIQLTEISKEKFMEIANDRKASEEFLHNFLLQTSQVIIVIVTNLTLSD